MNIVVFSDLHLHGFKFGASIASTGRNSRLQHGLDVLHWTAWLAIKEAKPDQMPVRLFAGDLFHQRGILRPSVLNPVLEHFANGEWATAGGIFDFMIPGNHDEEARSDGEHALAALRGAGDQPMVRDGFGFEIHPLSPTRWLGTGWVCHTPNVDELKARVARVCALKREAMDKMGGENVKTICLIHHGVDGAMPFIPDCGFSAADLPTHEFDFVFCGDYHNHKRLAPNAWMVGATMQHNFGDAGQPRGALVVDIDTGEAALHESPAPKFHTLEDKTEDPVFVDYSRFAGGFVRVRCDDPTLLAMHAEKATAAGALAVQQELVRDWAAITRADVTLSMTTSQMFAKWLEGQEVSALVTKSSVIALNDEILREAGVA